MVVTKQARRKKSGVFRWIVLFAIIAAVLFVKFSPSKAAQIVRERVIATLGDTEKLQSVIAAIGGSGDSSDPGLQEVFSQQSQGEPTISSQDEVYAASSGGIDDILGREKTLFPDAIDETIYPMEFTHAMPTSGEVSSTFGSRISPTTGQPGFHYGLDIAADEGTVIGSFADGTVREIGESSYGKYIIIDHADDFSTLYAHCSSISASVGDAVLCGEEIARVGQTGNATGPHLHLELWHAGTALDPQSYLIEV